MSSDQLLNYFCKKLGGESNDFYLTQDRLDRTARLQYVPKGISSRRSICAEPTSLQFMQQGVFRLIQRYLPTSSLRDHVSLEDQGYNRDLARKGSVDGSFCTIDLSSASDCVGLDLVRSAFRDVLPLYMSLMCTRSYRQKFPSGLELSTLKFAPMGSALCFPVECILFSAIVERRARENGIPRCNYRVYGDDIVAPSSLYWDLLDDLRHFGFIPNADKSFGDRDLPFRESCGGEYIHGVDVTPIRLSRKFSAEVPNVHRPSRISNFIELSNVFYKYYYRTSHEVCLHILQDGLGSRLFPFYSEVDLGLKTSCVQLSKLHIVHNDINGLKVAAYSVSDSNIGEYASEGLKTWLLAASISPDREDPLQVRLSPPAPRWSRTTLPYWCLLQ